METNLQKVKDLAVNLLYLDFEPIEEIPILVTHPYYEQIMVPIHNSNGQIEFADIRTEEGLFLARAQWKKTITRITKYTDFLTIIRKPYLPAFFKYTKDFVSADDYSEFLAEMWTMVEFVNQDKNISPQEFIPIFKKANKEVLMEENDMDVYRSFPDEVTVYRGINATRGSIKALSWTIDKSVAEFFANRFDTTGSGIIYSASIKKKDILAYFNTREEKEVLVDFRKLYNIKQYAPPALV